MKKTVVRMTREAAAHAVNPDKVKSKAEEAHVAAGGGDVWFLPFTAEGKQFALYARTIIEIGWFPHRAPNRVIRRVNRPVRVRR